MFILYALSALLAAGLLVLGTSFRVIKQFERGVVFRFGRVQNRRARAGTDVADAVG